MIGDLNPGRVVESKAGRDKGKLFVIMSVGDGCVFVADGKTRKTSSPKKKNLKHIATKPFVYDKIMSGYAAGEVLDARVREFLKRVQDSRKEE